MTIVQNSVVLQFLLCLWQELLALWPASRLKELIDRLDHFLSSWADGSLFCSLFRKEGIFLSVYPSSTTCRVVSFFANLVPNLLYGLHSRFRAQAEDSAACRLLLLGLGTHPIAFLSWVTLLLLIVPHELWNNAYGLLLAVGGLGLFYLGGTRIQGQRLRIDAMGPWWLAYTCFLCVAFLISFDHNTSLRYLCFHLTGLLLALLLVSSMKTVAQLLRITAFMTAGIVVASLYAFYQWFTGIDVNASNVDLSVNAGMPGRVYSFFENPNTFGQLLTMLIPLAIGLALASRTRRGKAAALVAALMGLLSIAMTYSRGSWIGLAAAAFIFVALYRRKLLPMLILISVAAIPLLPESILNRILTIFNFSDSSTSSRFPIYSAGLQTAIHNPVLGVGLGSDLVWESIRQSNYYKGTFTFVHLHNIFLQVWAECGTFGLLVFVGTILSSFKEGTRAASHSRCIPSIRPILIGAAAGLAGAMVCGLTDYIWYYPRVLCLFWLFVGILLSGAQLVKRSADA